LLALTYPPIGAVAGVWRCRRCPAACLDDMRPLAGAAGRRRLARDTTLVPRSAMRESRYGRNGWPCC